MPLIGRLLWVAVLTGGCADVAAPDTAPLTLAVSSRSTPGDPGPPLEGVRVCETGTTNCELSDDRGRVTIQLPIGVRTSFTMEKDDHASKLVPVVMSADGYQDVMGMGTDTYVAAQFERLDSPYPMLLTGAIGIFVWEPFAGATFELTGATFKAFYNDEEGWRSLDLEETTSFGFGGFVEVTPGDEYQVQVGGTAKNCTPIWGWPGDVENGLKFPVQAKYTTHIGVRCPAPP